jgi:mannose/fructose/N-acetylgalactosamine-specific phosphotransferase system component IID
LRLVCIAYGTNEEGLVVGFLVFFFLIELRLVCIAYGTNEEGLVVGFLVFFFFDSSPFFNISFRFRERNHSMRSSV